MVILFAKEIKYKAEVIAAERAGFPVLDFSMKHFLRMHSEANRSGFPLSPFKDSLPVFDTPKTTLLRGGVLNPFVYEALYRNLGQYHNLWLINGPDHYLETCSVVNYYEKIKEHTPITVWTNEIDPFDFIAQELLSNTFVPQTKLMIKDFMRSAKYERNQAYDIEDSSNTTEVQAAIEHLIAAKNGVLEGGVVFSEYTEFHLLHPTPLPFTRQPIYEEYRLWFFRGDLLLKTAYFEEMPDYASELSDQELAPFKAIAKTIYSNFFVMDIARHQNSEKLSIVEFNPGQTSGINYHNHHQFFKQLAKKVMND